MDTDIIPLGERALRTICEHVIAVGDGAETPYLEAKSNIDLSSKAGTVKIARFLLGAANRLPVNAARHFSGYAILVIGIEDGRMEGVARGTEAHELEDRLRPYLGPQFPGFELGRLAVNERREILFVIGLPPKDGQPPYPCHKNLQGDKPQNSVTDGGIYIRGGSNTRQAKASEVLALVERCRATPRAPIELDIKFHGSVSRVGRVSEVIEALYADEERRFNKRSSPQRHPYVPGILWPETASHTRGTELKRAEHLSTWKREQSANMEEGRKHFLGVVLPGFAIEIVSLNRYIAKPRLTITFHNCEAIDFQEEDDADYDTVVRPIITHGWASILKRSNLGMTRPRTYPVDWANRGDDAEVSLHPDSFRPDSPWRTDRDDYVLLCRDTGASSVRVSWSLTEEGNDTTTRGNMDVQAAPTLDAGELFVSVFLTDSK